MDQQDKKRKEEEQSQYIDYKSVLNQIILPTAKLEKVLTVPSAKQIASIDKEGFHQQQFKSAAKNTATAKVHWIETTCDLQLSMYIYSVG